MISPYGIGLSDFDNPEYEKQLAKLKVNIIAYQDEVGCVRDQFTIPRLKKNWKRLRDIHNRLKIEMWANCETFTWEEGTNDRNSALIPAAYPRLLSQQVAASVAPVDRIISFMFGGIIENPSSAFQLGQPVWSNVLYKNYMSWSLFQLVQCYGPIPLFKTSISEGNDPEQPRASVKEVYDHIIETLKEAETLLVPRTDSEYKKGHGVTLVKITSCK